MIALRYKDTFNPLSIFQFKQIFPRAVFRDFNPFFLQPTDRKMILQNRTNVFGDIGHQVKSIRLTQIDPFKNLIGTIRFDLAAFQPAD